MIKGGKSSSYNKSTVAQNNIRDNKLLEKEDRSSVTCKCPAKIIGNKKKDNSSTNDSGTGVLTSGIRTPDISRKALQIRETYRIHIKILQDNICDEVVVVVEIDPKGRAWCDIKCYPVENIKQNPQEELKNLVEVPAPLVVQELLSWGYDIVVHWRMDNKGYTNHIQNKKITRKNKTKWKLQTQNTLQKASRVPDWGSESQVLH